MLSTARPPVGGLARCGIQLVIPLIMSPSTHGLRLHLVGKIAELHRGRMELESLEGAGTTVRYAKAWLPNLESR